MKDVGSKLMIYFVWAKFKVSYKRGPFVLRPSARNCAVRPLVGLEIRISANKLVSIVVA